MEMKERKLEKGEISILILFSILSIVLFILSLKMYIKDPTLSSQGAFPLLLSTLMIIMSIFMFFDLRRFNKQSEFSSGLLNNFKEVYKFLFPSRTILIILLVIIYAIALPRIGFVISTFLFLWISMIALKKENYLKTLLVSAGIVAFIFLIFQTIFKVILP